MNYKILFKTAMLAGEIMLRSGAETFRVEDTMNRILALSNLKTVESFCTTTGIFATLEHPSMEPITKVKRIDKRVTNLNRIHMVNHISRRLCEGKMNEKEAYLALLNVKHQKCFSKKTVAIFTVLCMVHFIALLGGKPVDLLIGTLAGVAVILLDYSMDGKRVNVFISNVIKSMGIAVVTAGMSSVLQGGNQSLIMIGSMMVLVPGVPITNAIRDTLEGEYMAGIARACEAFVVAMAIAIGIAAGLKFMSLVGNVV